MNSGVRAWIFMACVVVLSLGADGSALAQNAPHPLPAEKTERMQIMNAMRLLAEKDLGAPVEFVVRELTVSKDWAFVNASAQYKGGKKINWVDTPYFKSLGHKTKSDVENALSVLPNCCTVQSILHKPAGGAWSVVEQKSTSTDVWWETYCKKPARVALVKWCKAQ